MSTGAIDALHDIHTATNDMLKAYREMRARAEPDIQSVVNRLTAMHEAHAAEQSAELVRLRESGQGNTSLQGSLNKVVVIMRDWVTSLDRDVLPAVRQGESSLRDEYAEALADDEVKSHVSVAALLGSQMDAIDAELARLPRGS